jgi:hypothetical protein
MLVQKKEKSQPLIESSSGEGMENKKSPRTCISPETLNY